MNVVPSVNTNVREVGNPTSSHFLNHKKRLTMNKAVVFAVVVALVAAGSMLPMVVFTF